MASVKSHAWQRWLILLFTCIMMIGNYYSYDIPAALHTQLDEYMGKPGNFETLFSLLYTVYSVPNIILPFFGGYFVDRLGVRLCLLVFAALITTGQIIFAFGVSIKSWPVMLLGRVIFGFGGESLGVGNSALLSQWFMGKELAFAFGLNLSIARLGSVFNNLLSPALANSAGVQFALWFGCILCGGSVFSVIMLSSIDKSFESNDTMHQLLKDEEEEEVDLKAKPEEDAPPSFKDVLSFPHAFWILVISCLVVYGCVLPFNNIASALLLERNYFMTNPSDCTLTDVNACQSSTNPPLVGICPTSTYYQPPLPATYVDPTTGTVYSPLTGDDIDCTVDSWKNGCGQEYCSRQSNAEEQVGVIMSIPYIISACLSPFLGAFVDKFGYRAVIATVAPGALILVHSLMGFSDVSPVGPLVGQGLSYAMFAAVLWPSIPLVMEPRFIGLAYGITTAIQNFGLAVFPLIIASIYTDAGDQYIPKAEEFFVGLACLGFLVGLYLNYYDFYNGHIFNSPGNHGDAADDHDDASLLSNTKSQIANADLSQSGRRALSSDGRHYSGDGSHKERRISSEIFATSLVH